MATTSSRTLSLLVALFLGGLLAWLLKPAGPPRSPAPVHPPFEAEKSNAVLVGPTAKEITITRLTLYKPDDVAWWNSRDPNKLLWIEFDEQVFANMGPGTFA